MYRDRESGYPYLKRCRIEQYILEKGYEIAPEGTEVLRLSVREDIAAEVVFEPMPRKKNAKEVFPIADFLVKSVKAQGVRLAPRQVKSVRFILTKGKRTPVGKGNPDHGPGQGSLPLTPEDTGGAKPDAKKQAAKKPAAGGKKDAGMSASKKPVPKDGKKGGSSAGADGARKSSGSRSTKKTGEDGAAPAKSTKKKP